MGLCDTGSIWQKFTRCRGTTRGIVHARVVGALRYSAFVLNPPRATFRENALHRIALAAVYAATRLPSHPCSPRLMDSAPLANNDGSEPLESAGPRLPSGVDRSIRSANSRSMTHHMPRASLDDRPEFMVTLGLAPPYTIEDVHEAYREMAKRVHPDRGGTTAAFNELHQAFEQAQAYVEISTDRRGWIASKMAQYMDLEQAVARLRRLGAVLTMSAPKSLEESFGDFAQLMDSVVLVRAVDIANGDGLVAAMVTEHKSLGHLAAIELPGCRVSDDAVLSLCVFRRLAHLDLSRTTITSRALAVVDALPALESIALDGVAIGWWTRRRIRSQLRSRTADPRNLWRPRQTHRAGTIADHV